MEHRDSVFTAHKPLLPLFNEAKATMPTRIEKCVMEMQDVDYELMYESGKDEAAQTDTLDYLSRHPLLETGDDTTEKITRWTVKTKHAVVIIRIREKKPKDELMQKLATRIVKGDWEKHKRDKDLEPIPSREARVVNRRTNFQRTAYSASSNLTEKTSQART